MHTFQNNENTKLGAKFYYVTARQRRTIKQQQRKTEIESEVASMRQEWIHHMYDTRLNRRACFLVVAPWTHVTVLRRPSAARQRNIEHIESAEQSAPQWRPSAARQNTTKV